VKREERLQQICEFLSSSNLPHEVPFGFAIQQIVGDASTRCYYRIHLPEGKSLMLMHMPEPFDPANFPYLDNYHLFRDRGVLLAEIYHMVPDRGLVFLQDLGDFTFYEIYQSWNDQTRLCYYLKAIEYLRAIENLSPVNGLAFNTERLLWELNFFTKHFLRGLRQVELTEEENANLDQCFIQLANELAETVRVFCHRDFHSRNLMVQDDRLYVVDFQDARLGPATYDLASLCYDSYIQHSPGLIRHLEQVFFTYHPDARIQRYEYPRMCLQRNLKALGTFGYQASQLGRTFYLQFVPPTIEYMKSHFEKLPEYEGLRYLLAKYMPELNG
jgi:aminoglycoside/choline kinase family phosphotransferase